MSKKAPKLASIQSNTNHIGMAVNTAIQSLQKHRPIFHSEDDFKFALAIELKDKLPSCEIRIEKPEKIDMQDYKSKAWYSTNASFDLVVIYDKQSYPIELKYKTKKLDIIYNDEEYNLKNQAAQTNSRYYFRKDIYRIEKYLQKHTNSSIGFFIVITNDMSYCNISANTQSSGYSFHHTYKLPQKSPVWKNKLKIDCTPLAGNYTINWQAYSSFKCTKNSKSLNNSKFCYTITEVSTKSKHIKPNNNQESSTVCQAETQVLSGCNIKKKTTVKK